MEDGQIIVGVVRIELSLPGARGLKDKRRLVTGLIERAQNRFRVCAAEVDHQDNWRRATVAFACLSNSTSHAHAVLAKVADFVERQADLVVMEFQVEIR
ncbi:MAG: DUF503 domain-containing protein [bacterium]|nr:DUF503 domain-containing protein [bacterium]